MENIREQVTLIGATIEQYDELTTNIVSARVKFEMLSLDPELGRSMQMTPRGPQEVVTTPSDIRENIMHLERQRATARGALKIVTGAEDVDGARQVYLDLLSAYQRLGGLRELDRMVEMGFPTARKEANESNLGLPVAREEAITEARAKLAAVAASVPTPRLIELPAESAIVLPTTDLILPR